MWIKKLPQELKRELRLRRLATVLRALAVALLVIGFGIPHAGFNVPTIARVAATLAAVILILAWYRRAHWRRLRSDVRVCERCNMVKLKDASGMCVCGGALMPLNEMKWLETPSMPDADCCTLAPTPAHAAAL